MYGKSIISPSGVMPLKDPEYLTEEYHHLRQEVNLILDCDNNWRVME